MVKNALEVGDELPKSRTCPTCHEVGKHRLAFGSDDVFHLQCRTCGKVNAFEGEVLGTPPAKPLVHEVLSRREAAKETVSYRPNGSFDIGSYIDHAVFGLGYVLSLRSPPVKMEVLFAEDRRVMVCRPPKASPKRSKAAGRKSKAKAKPSATAVPR